MARLVRRSGTPISRFGRTPSLATILHAVDDAARMVAIRVSANMHAAYETFSEP